MGKTTKQKITECFWSLLAEKPYEQITVSEITRQANVARITFYYYFDGIPHIVRDSVLPVIERLMKKRNEVEKLFSAEESVALFFDALELYEKNLKNKVKN